MSAPVVEIAARACGVAIEQPVPNVELLGSPCCCDIAQEHAGVELANVAPVHVEPFARARADVVTDHGEAVTVDGEDVYVIVLVPD